MSKIKVLSESNINDLIDMNIAIEAVEKADKQKKVAIKEMCGL